MWVVEFVTFDILIRFKTVLNLTGNCFCLPIIFKNTIKSGLNKNYTYCFKFLSWVLEFKQIIWKTGFEEIIKGFWYKKYILQLLNQIYFVNWVCKKFKIFTNFEYICRWHPPITGTTQIITMQIWRIKLLTIFIYVFAEKILW